MKHHQVVTSGRRNPWQPVGKTVELVMNSLTSSVNGVISSVAERSGMKPEARIKTVAAVTRRL